MEQPFFCTYGYNTTVGDNFFLNVNDKLMDSGKITIGNNVFIAPNVCIITEEHAMDVGSGWRGWSTRIPFISATMFGFVPVPSSCPA